MVLGFDPAFRTSKLYVVERSLWWLIYNTKLSIQWLSKSSLAKRPRKSMPDYCDRWPGQQAVKVALCEIKDFWNYNISTLHPGLARHGSKIWHCHFYCRRLQDPLAELWNWPSMLPCYNLPKSGTVTLIPWVNQSVSMSIRQVVPSRTQQDHLKISLPTAGKMGEIASRATEIKVPRLGAGSTSPKYQEIWIIQSPRSYPAVKASSSSWISQTHQREIEGS